MDFVAVPGWKQPETDELDEGRASRRTAAWEQPNISGYENRYGPRQAEDDMVGRPDKTLRDTGSIHLAVHKHRDRAFMARLVRVRMEKGVNGRQNRHGLD